MLQKEALDILKLGKNVFITGPAGSGKTFVLNQYIKYLKSNGVDVAVTASTGIASTHLGGQTIHSWSGLGIRDVLTDRDIDELMQKSYLYKRFERTKVLIIDEISMLHHFRLDLIDWICRQFKRNEKPFGGMQVVLCGDFFQLPPVTRTRSSFVAESRQQNKQRVDLGLVGLDKGRPFGEESQFAYKSTSWQESGFTICYLSEQFRQKDSDYLKILNEIRRNAVSEKTKELLNSRLNKEPEIKVKPVKMHTHNISVDEINNQHLSSIEGKKEIFEMTSHGSKYIVEALKKSCISPESLVLKVGAKVMFTKNHPEGLFVNGTMGVVDSIGYGSPRVRTADGSLIDVTPMSWRVEEDGKTKAEISQFPLRLAWAITVHKSQGMSLDAMEVDLSDSFVPGMGYVALSRVRSLGGMKLLGFNAMSLEVDKEVLKKDLEFQEFSKLAEKELSSISRLEIEKRQGEFLHSIKPKEKNKLLKTKSVKSKKRRWW